jgi:hypothetical protein
MTELIPSDQSKKMVVLLGNLGANGRLRFVETYVWSPEAFRWTFVHHQGHVEELEWNETYARLTMWAKRRPKENESGWQILDIIVAEGT